MKTLLTITLILLFKSSFEQKPTNISGKIIDENGKRGINAMVHYGYLTNDTSYTDKQGRSSYL